MIIIRTIDQRGTIEGACPEVEPGSFLDEAEEGARLRSDRVRDVTSMVETVAAVGRLKYIATVV